MSRLSIEKRLKSFWRWLEGDQRPRQASSTLLLDTPVSLPAPQPASPPVGATGARAPMLQPARTRLDRAKVARVFDSSHPVRTRDELFGRAGELDLLISATLDFGQHAIVHGARGSGKTSLVRIYGDHADQQGAIVIYMACEPNASFADLMWPYLRALPAVALKPEERAAYREGLATLPEQFGPRALVDLVVERVAVPSVFIFDEFDRITDPVVKADIAAAMKLLSDSLSHVLFMLVGIARSVADVIDSHPSLRRHMRVVSLGRIEPASVDALIDAGERIGGLRFDDDARQLIARVSCGSPYHIRMFCHHSALRALRRGSDRIGEDEVREGLADALKDWAAMNIDDARHFVSLVERGALLGQVEKIAREAALRDRVSIDEDDARALLSDALAPEAGSQGTLVFRDSVAPQFLIAYVVLAEREWSDPPMSPALESEHAANR